MDPINMDAYKGTVVHCLQQGKIEVLQNYVVGVDRTTRGQILFVEPSHQLEDLSKQYDMKVHSLSDSQFLMPGLVDTHIHAPQYKFTGTGYDKTLLDWLDTYTIPNQITFEDVEVARKIYPTVVQQTLKHGTTTASYHATLHLESTKELCRIIDRSGQRALVGKLSNDRSLCNHKCTEGTEQCLQSTREFIQFVDEMKNPLIQPAITPSWIASSSEALLKALGDIARDRNLPIQSHLCEQKSSIEYCLSFFPGYTNCASVFEATGLMTSKTYMAHCIYLDKAEIEIIKKNNVGVAHCPNSNFCLKSGCLDVRKLLDLEIKVGLGTDVSGGYSPSMFDALRMALHTSKAVWFKKQDDKDSHEYTPLSHHEALYLATMGGARVLGLDDKIGNFQMGKEFDALIIDTAAPHGDPVFHTYDTDTIEGKKTFHLVLKLNLPMYLDMQTTLDRVSKFLYLGDDRNIVTRYVAGREIILTKNT